VKKIKIELFYQAEAKVTYKDEPLPVTENFISKYCDEIEIDPDNIGGETHFDDYKLMYESTIEHLNCKAENTWCKNDPPTSVEIKITQLTEEEYSKKTSQLK
jgi:hypothetical protein